MHDGQQLTDFKGEKLTIHGELNKLIANITLFRDGAGMHWRTDGIALGANSKERLHKGLETGGNLLGEQMAISMLRDIKCTYREEVGTFKFNSISGNPIKI